MSREPFLGELTPLQKCATILHRLLRVSTTGEGAPFSEEISAALDEAETLFRENPVLTKIEPRGALPNYLSAQIILEHADVMDENHGPGAGDTYRFSANEMLESLSAQGYDLQSLHLAMVSSQEGN